MSITRYLDPRNDLAFKKIFGVEKNKHVLMDFLNDVLYRGGKDLITEVLFLNPTQNPEVASYKESIEDVLCTDQHGMQYIVEMQVAKVRGFEKRAQYYAAKAYINQMREGERYEGQRVTWISRIKERRF
ncbi:MAG: Rpn family recombination-promoting nuclease/putative transposase [Candidatus Midichloria sp.]|nr:Rpn family recombination-promoting nuclease/putative transposase [Candidatus Midichloria sp.]